METEQPENTQLQSEVPNSQYELKADEFVSYTDPNDFLKQINSIKKPDGTYQIVCLSNLNRYTK